MKLTPENAIGTRVYYDAEDHLDRGHGTIVRESAPHIKHSYYVVKLDADFVRHVYPAQFEFTSHREWFTATEWVDHLRALLSGAQAEVRAEVSKRGERAERAERKS